MAGRRRGQGPEDATCSTWNGINVPSPLNLGPLLREMASKRLRVLIASYNTAQLGHDSFPEDLAEWLTPHHPSTSSEFSENAEAPDIIAVGFQELLPLPFGLAGLSEPVLSSRDKAIREQIEQSPGDGLDGQRYSLIAKHFRVGIAMLLYAREETVARRVRDVQIRSVGCGPFGMGNKGAVGTRFRIEPEIGEGEGELFTFITCHLAAHAFNLPRRIIDFKTVVSQLLFDPVPGSSTTGPSQIYSTSHLFLFGDLNFRLAVPADQEHLSSLEGLEQLRQYDQLSVAKQERKTLHGLHEGPFWKFKPTYKYIIGSDRFHGKRFPSWTDRILFATCHPTVPIEPLLYTSIQSYTTSDHKPVMSLLLLPPSSEDPNTPLLSVAAPYPPNPRAWIWNIIGTTLDRIVGWLWCILRYAGVGYSGVGALNLLVLVGAALWWFGVFSRS